jgi:hypothetical protein
MVDGDGELREMIKINQTLGARNSVGIALALTGNIDN